jgi:hypothetical protein
VCHAWPTTRVAEEGHVRRPADLQGEWDGQQNLAAGRECMPSREGRVWCKTSEVVKGYAYPGGYYGVLQIPPSTR